MNNPHYQLKCLKCRSQYKLAIVSNIYRKTYSIGQVHPVPCPKCRGNGIIYGTIYNTSGKKGKKVVRTTSDPQADDLKKYSDNICAWLDQQDTSGALKQQLLSSYTTRRAFYKEWSLEAYIQEVFPRVWKRYRRI